MSHLICHVKTFETVAPYTLRVGFDDGTSQTINFRPALAGKLHGPLRDLALFNQVRIDPEVHTLVWPNGADFDPATLHDWPEVASAWEQRARQLDQPTAVRRVRASNGRRSHECRCRRYA